MQVTTHVDVDVVAVEEDDEVTVMLEIVAPTATADEPRPPATVQVVLDRSGSMSGERLDAAKLALVGLVDRLSPEDRLGVVMFDHEVEVPFAAQALADKDAARRAITRIHAGGTTNLSAGLLRGLQEAERVKGDAGATLLVVSDGHANDGVTDPDQLGALAAGAASRGITTTTIGIGRGYDEALLSAVARGGRGGHAFARDGDGAAHALAGEVDGLLASTVSAASLTVAPEASVDSLTLWNDLPTSTVDGAVVAEIGDLWSGETRKLVLTFAVPARATLGLAKVATLTVRSVAVPAMEEQTVTLEVHVNVVPGDQAAGRVPDPVVRTELLTQQVQKAKHEAAERIAGGDVDGARDAMRMAHASLCDRAPAPGSELDLERGRVEGLIDDLDRDAAIAAKRARAQFNSRNRKPGRG